VLHDSRTIVYVDDSLPVSAGETPTATVNALREAVDGKIAELYVLHNPDAVFQVRPSEVRVDRLTTAGGEPMGVRFVPINLSAPPRAIYYRPPTVGQQPPWDDDWYEEIMVGEDGPVVGARTPPAPRTIVVLVRKGKRP